MFSDCWVMFVAHAPQRDPEAQNSNGASQRPRRPHLQVLAVGILIEIPLANYMLTYANICWLY